MYLSDTFHLPNEQKPHDTILFDLKYSIYVNTKRSTFRLLHDNSFIRE